MKIYIVISQVGEYEDYEEVLIQGFTSREKAERYLNELEDYFDAIPPSMYKESRKYILHSPIHNTKLDDFNHEFPWGFYIEEVELENGL